MTYATKINGAWVALPFGQQVVIGETAVPYAVLEGWTAEEQEAFGAFPVPEPGLPPAGKVESSRTLGGTSRPKWVVTYIALPPAPEPEPEYRTLVSKLEYYGLFEPLEEATIRLIASKTVTAEMVEAATDPVREQLMAVLVLRVMLNRADNLAPNQMIDLADHQVQKGLALCELMGGLESGRPAEISRGVLQAR